jgi:cell division septation protein DedD
VVSYSQPQLAKQELERLTQRGEPAFLMETNQLTILCVGPFATREHAKAKLTNLRPRYRDCFVRSL